MATFADMEHIRFDYNDSSIMFVTVFDDIAHMDTSPVEGYMILACSNGKLQVDVNGFAGDHL